MKSIQNPISKEMEIFGKKFKAELKSKVWMLDKITSYMLKQKGKQVRPVLVFLSAGLAGGISEASYRGASLIELLHTATLVHDDVVDASEQRRGFFSVNALWGDKVAVLLGDYLLAKGLLLSLDHNDFKLLQIVSKAVKEMSEGELLQLEKARKLDITEDVYYEIIRQKTATLIEACCAVGVASTGADDATVQKAALMGEKIGMAFQIKDDLFDFGTDEIGKPLGIDIKEKKMTLPLIYALSQADKSTQRKIRKMMRNHNEDPKKINEIIDFVKKSDGLGYATKVMNQYITDARKILDSFPESDYRTSMHDLISYVIERKK
ncbi:octaprenyl-diphosphate synthase [Sediminitomix flava]|uniref:Octaprenyl-diphosphate synthase n=2 Tax=Sediminitomix flava TaxID=379075 RepID=A0A315ZEW2_SEDFL|nr:octaprenyl-diphosphate synthase [Sediminitomix flava]